MVVQMCDRKTISLVWEKISPKDKLEIMKYLAQGNQYAPVDVKYLDNNLTQIYD